MQHSSRLSDQQIVFLGAGSMSEALLRGIVEAKLVRSLSVVALNRYNRARLDDLKAVYGIRVPETYGAEERQSLINEADIVVLAMKPKDAGAAFVEDLARLRPDQLIVSVVAGLSIETMERLLGRPQPIVRTMPNTSSTIGLGATGLAFSETVSAEQREMALQMLGAVGKAVPLPEDKLNLVTGLSGSGPAYVYYLMESMIAAGMDGGLSETQARELVVQTVLGAAHMVEATGEPPSVLRAKVTSPNGTTFAAIGVLEQYRFQEGMRKAIARAAERAGEMGDEIAAAALQQAKE
ncbi:pyrroline-5-carboxylate reductase [Paenibacillus sp. TRM 82003]|nr:pyrroline-5-carboxylate reductase [Paenibacillus sp. TRM 82003]